jgi:hypothetical protein
VSGGERLLTPERILFCFLINTVTALGLRYIVVLGGETGGEVVGILTRANFIDKHIETASGF